MPHSAFAVPVELVLAGCPVEVGSKGHTGLEGWVTHDGCTSALLRTELYCETGSIGDDNGRLVCEPGVCEECECDSVRCVCDNVSVCVTM